MNNKKYHKYLSKYLKKSSSTENDILDSFKKEFGHLKTQGLKIRGLTSLIDDFTVISVSYPKGFRESKIPANYKGISIRAHQTNE